MAEPDIPYAYDLMQRTIAAVTVNGAPLTSLLIDDKHNLWHRFVQWAFFDDYTRFSATKNFADMRDRYVVTESAHLPFGAFIFGMIAAIITGVSFLFVMFGRSRVLIYSVDKLVTRFRGDGRLERVYAYLHKHNVVYTEVFHTILGRSFFNKFVARGRVPVYFEGIEWVYFVGRMVKRLVGGRDVSIVIGGLDNFTPDEKLQVQATVKKFVSVAPLFRFRRSVLSFVLKHSRVRVVFATDDARHYQELAAAAHDNGIPSYAFQHGQVMPYFMGWLKDERYKGEYFRPDYFVVWSEYWKKELIALKSVWPEENIMVGGSPKVTLAAEDIVRARSADARTVLVPYEIDAPVSLIKEFVAAAKDADIVVIFKLRADIPKDEQLAPYAFGPRDVEVITSLAELKTPITAVVGAYSTFLYDAVETLVPVGLLDSPLLHSKRMVTNGIANRVSVESLAHDIDVLAALPETELEARKTQVAVVNSFSMTLEGILKSTKLV